MNILGNPKDRRKNFPFGCKAIEINRYSSGYCWYKTGERTLLPLPIVKNLTDYRRVCVCVPFIIIILLPTEELLLFFFCHISEHREITKKKKQSFGIAPSARDIFLRSCRPCRADGRVAPDRATETRDPDVWYPPVASALNDRRIKNVRETRLFYR